MTNRSKFETFVGFAIKARALISGTNAVATLRGAKLILVCFSASDNAKKTAESYAVRFSCPLITTKILLEDLVGKENCKIAAITDKNLARAIIDADKECSVGAGGKRL